MRKICFITTIPLTIESFLLRTAQYIKDEYGCEVHFISSADNHFLTKLPKDMFFHQVTFKRGIDFRIFSLVFRLYSIFRREKFDLIQYATPNASFYSSIAGFLSGTKVRLYAQWGLLYYSKTGIRRYFLKSLEKITCLFSTHIQPLSEKNREFAISEKLYRYNKSSVIGLGSAQGIDFRIFDIHKKDQYRFKIRKKLKIDNRDFIIGFLSRKTEDKGVNELIKAFMDFNEKYPISKLLYCGPIEANDGIDDKLRLYTQTSEKVICVDFVDNSYEYFSAMDIFVFPTYREGFGEVSIEAQAMGIPIITTDIPGPSESVRNGETGILVAPRQTKELYSAMEQLYVDERLRNKMSENGPIWVKENFDSVEVIKRVSEFKINLIDKSYSDTGAFNVK